MPRLRALILLALFVVNQAACTSWQAPKVTPQEYATHPPGGTVRVTPKDPQGNPQRSVVLTGARFARDSVTGRDHKNRRIAFSLQQVAAIEVRRPDDGATGLLLVGVAALIAGGVVVAIGVGNSLSCILSCY